MTPKQEFPTVFEKSRPCVLVIDDDEALLRMLRRLLSSQGCIPLTASSAARARELVAQAPRLSVCLVDLSLADGDGIELIGELKAALGSAAPTFVIMSGYEILPPPGIERVLTKPVGVVRLMDCVKQSVRSRRLRAASGVVPVSSHSAVTSRSARPPVACAAQEIAVVSPQVDPGLRSRR